VGALKTGAMGKAITVTATVLVATQVPVVLVTVYIVLLTGEAVIIAPFALLKLVAGAQV
jgi:hypothetical protein